jgi:Aromatic-ring-opening dioxygenase LigAB, LigA subunit
MSRYQVDKLLRDLRRDRDLAGRFRENIDAVLADYELDGTERELLKRWQIRELYDRGVNPLLLLLAHGTTGRSMRDYAELMKPRNRSNGG